VTISRDITVITFIGLSQPVPLRAATPRRDPTVDYAQASDVYATYLTPQRFSQSSLPAASALRNTVSHLPLVNMLESVVLASTSVPSTPSTVVRRPLSSLDSQLVAFGVLGSSAIDSFAERSFQIDGQTELGPNPLGGTIAIGEPASSQELASSIIGTRQRSIARDWFTPHSDLRGDIDEWMLLELWDFEAEDFEGLDVHREPADRHNCPLPERESAPTAPASENASRTDEVWATWENKHEFGGLVELSYDSVVAVPVDGDAPETTEVDTSDRSEPWPHRGEPVFGLEPQVGSAHAFEVFESSIDSHFGPRSANSVDEMSAGDLDQDSPPITPVSASIPVAALVLAIDHVSDRRRVRNRGPMGSHGATIAVD
jgi:hypothetical protein